jgi:hypothetical protein
MSVLPVQPGRAGLLQDQLLVQASADAADIALSLANRSGSGVVLSGPQALTAGLRLANTGPAVPLLCDRRRYAGKSRVSGRAPFDSRWLDGQRRLNVPHVLSDSGYIGHGDLRALVTVLDQAVAAGDDVTAVLPIHTSWLRSDLTTFVSEISARHAPVALALEHRDDPLGVLETVHGLVTLIRQVPAVGLLCSDVSALGALAFGASWAAVGVRTSLRHLYPADGGFGRSDGMPSALVDPALALIKVGKIAAGWAATTDDPVWACGCTVCHGRTLDWLLSATAEQANQHTFELLLDRRDKLMNLPGPLREQSWRAMCASAAFQYEALALAGVSWDVPRFLRHWQTV